MATRLYFPSTKTAPIAPAFDLTIWDNTTGAVRRGLSLTLTDTAFVTQTVTKDGTHLSGEYDVVRQYISEPILNPGILSGTVQTQMRAMQAGAGADIEEAISIRVLSNNGSVIRGVLYQKSAVNGRLKLP